MRYYENIAKTSENRLPQRCYYIPENDGAYTLLNGQWRFHYYERDVDVEENITKWDTIPVPSCWQSLGYENPNYSNVEYPYPVDPPYVPDENPCGVYEREFTVENTDNRTYFVFEGVASSAKLMINGKYVGFTMGNHLQSEFDITDFVEKGENTVRVYVLKWTLGSYLEDQDFFRFNGIFRDVYILSRPQGHIVDIDIHTENNADIIAKFDGSAEVELYDQGKLIDKKQADGCVSFHIDNAVLWNAEKPYLYKLKFIRNGEIISCRVGFRTISISDKYELLINDTPVKIQGVNHHDTHPKNGWTMTNEEIRHDLEQMKKLNINAIRTSHYPPTPYFLDLCDEMGFYVTLETDLETHGFVCRYGNEKVRCGFDVESMDWLCNKPEWKQEYVERMQRAVERDKNHACIFMWSTGNESGYGPNHRAMIKWTRERDNTRLIQCEDASRKASNKSHPELYNERYDADIYSRMYLSVESCREYCENAERKQPLYLCEYAHAMGNGPGDIYDYWELVDEQPKFIGGCVWEWADHTFIDGGVPKYGGDYPTELVHMDNFCCDGMVMCDRSFKAGSYEVKTAYQPIRMYLEDGKIRIWNRMSFTNLNEYTLKLSVECDGETLAESNMTLDVEPKANAFLDIPDCIPDTCKYGCYITVRLYDSTGYEVAVCQSDLDVETEKIGHISTLARLSDDGKFITATGDGFEYKVEKLYGTIVSIKIDGVEKLASPMMLTCYRAPIDNERHAKKKWIRNEFNYGENLDAVFNKIYSCEIINGSIVSKGSLAGVARKPFMYFETVVTVGSDGRIEFTVNAHPREGCVWLPRFGYEFALCEDNAKFSFFGKGPGENYCDLNRYSTYGMWHSDAASEYFAYIMPQEHGNHFGVRYLEFDNGMKFVADDPFECNISKYSSAAIGKASHIDEVVSDGNTHVRIDYKNSGIGSHSCGPELIEKYRLNDTEILFKFSIKL